MARRNYIPNRQLTERDRIIARVAAARRPTVSLVKRPRVSLVKPVSLVKRVA